MKSKNSLTMDSIKSTIKKSGYTIREFNPSNNLVDAEFVLNENRLLLQICSKEIYGKESGVAISIDNLHFKVRPHIKTIAFAKNTEDLYKALKKVK